EREGRFLITKRQKGVHLEGYWEFPGGKCDAGETIDACVSRELREELDVDVQVGEEMFTTSHAYPTQTVELHFVVCRLLCEHRPQVGQEMQWALREDLGRLLFPPADAELIRRLISRSA